jgi:hypothetical protein
MQKLRRNPRLKNPAKTPLPHRPIHTTTPLTQSAGLKDFPRRIELLGKIFALKKVSLPTTVKNPEILRQSLPRAFHEIILVGLN